MVNKSDLYVMERPIDDGYVSLKSFDEAAREGSIADDMQSFVDTIDKMSK